MSVASYLGRTPIRLSIGSIQGRLVAINSEPFYRIENYDRMRPFLMSLVSESDHWMFISSNGGLTSGRGNPDKAVFPYDTEDKIQDAVETTGPKTLLWVDRGTRRYLWEPFSLRGRGLYRVRRNLSKNLAGNQLIFEEINLDLGLTFRYGWFNSHRFGFVRKAVLENHSARLAKVQILDGVQNLIPPGIGSQFQLEKSNLIDAYKKSELVQATGLGLFVLSSIPVDRPEPAEALRATTVWSLGLPRARMLLSAIQVDRFREGNDVTTETEVRAERGAYFVCANVRLPRGRSIEWWVGVDGNQGPSQVAELNRLISRPRQLRKLVQHDIDRGTDGLKALVACADGLQKSARPLGDARHFNNVLFNIMRGGLFVGGSTVEINDLRDFVHHANRKLAARHARFFRRLGKRVALRKLLAAAQATGDANLERLCREYLPLTFSRRHGDPSRPWNRFSIPSRDNNGARILHYEGNWRDIFQNWEALAISYPAFAPGMVCRFVNASTADGYNPYRITRDGFEWEVADPHDPWSHIGYWGDHQVIYLLKLLEIVERHDPGSLRSFLVHNIFSYAHVPYRIRPFAQLLADPRETVDFVPELDQLIRNRVRTIGSDGKSICRRPGEVYLVNLTEKLLVLLLAKLANFVPDAGIWLNTQRPEWNDANNALVGQGASVVTVCALRRFLKFCIHLLGSLSDSGAPVSVEVASWFNQTRHALQSSASATSAEATEQHRRRVLERLGRVAGRYRSTLYHRGLSGRKFGMKKSELLEFLQRTLRLAEQTIQSNRAEDGLYHAYNLLKFENGRSLPIRRLYPMLEGQVAVLSSGLLSAQESLEVLTALRHSALYRANQHSYLLYPDRRLATFREKNNIPPKEIGRSRLLKYLVRDGNRMLVEKDVTGRFHFHPGFANARDLTAALDRVSLAGYASLVKAERHDILQLYETLFDHESFTGRSGTFFGYEGLGCIYWHMVSKLLLAVQETFFRALEADESPGLIAKLAEAYYDIRSGIGDYKTPAECGVFPMDPYSHTPAHAGARQPGLTGQVKEDILCRWGELGVQVHDGRIRFQPALLRRQEFLARGGAFDYVDTLGHRRSLRLPLNSLVFTYCQVPVTYQISYLNEVRTFRNKGGSHRAAGLCLDAETSDQILARTGEVQRLVVTLTRSELATLER